MHAGSGRRRQGGKGGPSGPLATRPARSVHSREQRRQGVEVDVAARQDDAHPASGERLAVLAVAAAASAIAPVAADPAASCAPRSIASRRWSRCRRRPARARRAGADAGASRHAQRAAEAVEGAASGTKSVKRSPRASDAAVSEAPVGSATKTSHCGATRRAAASTVPDASPPPPTGTTSASSCPQASDGPVPPWPGRRSPGDRCRSAERRAGFQTHGFAARFACGDGGIAAVQRGAVGLDRGQAPGGDRAIGNDDVAIDSARAGGQRERGAVGTDECVTTPRAAAASVNAQTALQAPRNLNAPARCNCSHLNHSSRPGDDHRACATAGPASPAPAARCGRRRRARRRMWEAVRRCPCAPC